MSGAARNRVRASKTLPAKAGLRRELEEETVCLPDLTRPSILATRAMGLP